MRCDRVVLNKLYKDNDINTLIKEQNVTRICHISMSSSSAKTILKDRVKTKRERQTGEEAERKYYR